MNATTRTALLPRTAPRHAARGSMAVPMLLLMVGLVAMLGLVEVGYLYWARRDTQKVADLAALAGAQRLPDCTDATAAANGNATADNRFDGDAPRIACGNWNPGNTGAADRFAPAGASTAAPNAVQVIATRPVAPIFGFTSALPGVRAEAVAANAPPLAIFSVSPSLATVDGGALGGLLQGLGLNVDAGVLGAYGVADVNITPSGLLHALGLDVSTATTAGGMDSLLSTKVSLGQLLDAAVTAAAQQNPSMQQDLPGLLSANVSLLQSVGTALGADVSGVLVSLGATAGGPGVLAQLDGPSAQGGLDAQVNALQVIGTAIGVASMGHAVSVPSLDVSLPAPLDVATVSSAIGVVEAPSVGIGGVGTTAYSGQVRLFVDIETPQPVSLLGGLVSLQLHLPIAIDLVDAKATLTDLCSTSDGDGHPQATVQVTSQVLKVCAGKITKDDAFSTALPCDQIPTNDTRPVLALSVAGLGASLNSPIDLNALATGGSGTLIAGQTKTIPQNGNALDIGGTIGNALDAVLAVLATQPTSATAAQSQQAAQSLAQSLWNATAAKYSGCLIALTCNNQHFSDALQQLQNNTSGLQTFLGTAQLNNLLGDALSADLGAALGAAGGLVGNLATQLLGGLGCTLGSTSACVSLLAQDIQNINTPSSYPPAYLGLLDPLLQALEVPLTQLGSTLSTALNGLGIKLGPADVHMQSIQCHRTQLVY